MTVLDQDHAVGHPEEDPAEEQPEHPGGRGEESDDRLRVVGWPDPVIDGLGHDPRSWYVEHFWLPVLGPTSTWFMRRCAAGLDMAPGGLVLGRDDTARALGLGGRQGRHSPFARAVTRCVTFEVARWRDAETIAVRRMLPPLPRRHLLRLPPRLLRMHEAFLATKVRLPDFEQHRRRARRLAMGLLELGDAPDAMEGQLLRWGVHPALAHDAVTWARDLPTPA